MEPVMLKVDKLQMELEDGALRYISYNQVELVRGIYAAVRDHNWDTIPPVFSSLEVTEHDKGGLTVSFQSEHKKEEIDFVWQGTILIQSDCIQFDFVGYARSACLANRIGFCVLHPMSFAGLPLEIQSNDEVINGEFPLEIAPHQPFKAITAMTYQPVKDMLVRITFEGDLFEMEDQRNWTDASYKTYCTPLDNPFPVEIQAGQTIKQSIKLQLQLESSLLHIVESSRDTLNKPNEPVKSNQANDSNEPNEHNGEPNDLKEHIHRIEVSKDASQHRLPDIGYSISQRMPTELEQQWLKQLRPDFLRLELNLTENNWREKWLNALQWCLQFGCGMDLELLYFAKESSESSFQEFIGLLSTEMPWTESASTMLLLVRSITPFAINTFVSDSDTIQTLQQALKQAGLHIAVGGGTRAYYAEHNRAALPLELINYTSYSINPQVHAFDDKSLMETLPAQQVTAMDASMKTGKPLHVGPITLKPRINPNATNGDSSIPLVDQIDERQHTMFGAAWTLGSVAALCNKATPLLHSITYFELLGPIGLVNNDAYPLFYVLRDIAEWSNAQARHVNTSSEDIAVLALQTEIRMRLLVANLTSRKQQAAIEIGSYEAVTIRALESHSYQQHCSNPMSKRAAVIAGQGSGPLPIKLEPYAYICLDFEGWQSN